MRFRFESMKTSIFEVGYVPELGRFFTSYDGGRGGGGGWRLREGDPALQSSQKVTSRGVVVASFWGVRSRGSFVGRGSAYPTGGGMYCMG